jgi:phosphatidylinositol kinase/protein kinase (PI-3  family)
LHQAQLVSKELIRVAILWHEMWHEALEEASRMYFGEHNIEGMLAVLEPLHAMLERGAETIKENAFIQVLFHQNYFSNLNVPTLCVLTCIQFNAVCPEPPDH